MNGTINELKQGLLKCANENENRTYFTGQVIISSICKCAKDTIEALEKENEELKAQNEKMRCCGNCNFQDMYGDCVLEAPIWCNKIYEGGSDEWELAKRYKD